ncbi:MAG: hypothetical protein SXV54_00320 [Chloroflexota bacterium]|nr:hypothetical protein [Chloroflexota bacterium]
MREKIERGTVEWAAQEADSRGLLEPVLKDLPVQVAETLRATVAGERPLSPLSPDEISLLGQVVARWEVPSVGRWILFGGPPLTVEELGERLGLPADKAARIEAVVRWPIGFTRDDLAQWGLLSPEETEALWEHIQREHGLYGAGTRYAAP